MNGDETEGDGPSERDDQARGGDKLVKGGGGEMLTEGGTQGGDMLADRGEEEMLAEGGAYQAEGREEDMQGEGVELAEEEEEGDEMMAAELVIGIENPLT